MGMLPWKDAFEKYSDKKLPKSMTLNQWLNMWGRLCYGSAGIADFPIWVQILPEIFFKVMDKSHNGILTCDDIKNFYKGLIGIKDPAKLEKTMISSLLTFYSERIFMDQENTFLGFSTIVRLTRPSQSGTTMKMKNEDVPTNP